MADVTDILARARRGEQAAQAELLPAVYRELRALAASYFRGRSGGQTLQPTALVHEAYLRLIRHDAGEIRDRSHFMAVAATAMRQILTDQARRRQAQKRGGPEKARVTLSEVAGETPVDLVALDDLLTKLAALDERQARLVELRFFAGMTEDEVADALGVSRRTVQKEWRKAKAWLTAELEPPAGTA